MAAPSSRTRRCGTHVVDIPILSRTPGQKVAGQAFPVITDNDMLPGLQALDVTPPGSVLFIHNVARRSEALAGDIFKWLELAIFGGIRPDPGR